MAKKKKRIWLAGPKADPVCCAGPPDDHVCHNLSLLEAEKSDFHDDALIEATAQINKIFVGLAPPTPEHHLALIDTSVGLLLIWTKSSRRPNDISGYVTYRSREKAIRQWLRIKDESAPKGASSAQPEPSGAESAAR